MLQRCRAGCARRLSLVMLAGSLGLGALPGWSQAREGSVDALLAIDQHRASVVERVVDTWGARLAKSSALVPIDELRTRLLSLRADQLLAASLAGTLDGLREVIGADTLPATKPGLRRVKALGDSALDIVYTPVTPCRLVETRGTFAAVYQGDGSVDHTPVPFAPNEIRSYTVQGGNGVCLTQLPGGLNPSAVQLQVFGMPTTAGSGDIEILPQGATFGSTATMVYIASIAFNTVSTNAKINLANNQISVQVRGGGANLAIDVVGYFKSAADATAMNFNVNGQRVMRYEYNATSPNVIGGNPDNSVGPGAYGSVIAGGGFPGSGTCVILGVTKPCQNRIGNSGFDAVGGGSANVASGGGSVVSGGTGNTSSGLSSSVAGGTGNTAGGLYSAVAGGLGSTASADYSFAAGRRAKATTTGSFMWADSRNFDFQPSVSNFFGVRATGGVGFTVAIDPNTGGVTQFCNYLPGYSGWSCTSDRNAKENFVPVDGGDILRRLVAMPISTWNYKGADPTLRMLGPTAQDFLAAFALGKSDTTIATGNVEGVALAAIQGLHQLVQEKDAKIEAQRHRIAELEYRVAHVESLRSELDAVKHALLQLTTGDARVAMHATP